MAEKKLSPKQFVFVQEYLIDFNATQAAIRAGYSAKTANEQGARLLTKASVHEAIASAMQSRAEESAITAEYVRTCLKTVVERSLEAVPVLDSEGNETGQWKFNAAGANKALELLGKHLGMFVDKVDHRIMETPKIELILNAPGTETGTPSKTE